jgi:hypothetical protein
MLFLPSCLSYTSQIVCALSFLLRDGRSIRPQWSQFRKNDAVQCGSSQFQPLPRIFLQVPWINVGVSNVYPPLPNMSLFLSLSTARLSSIQVLIVVRVCSDMQRFGELLVVRLGSQRLKKDKRGHCRWSHVREVAELGAGETIQIWIHVCLGGLKQ